MEGIPGLVKDMMKVQAGFQANIQWAIGVKLQLPLHLQGEMLKIDPIRQSVMLISRKKSANLQLSMSLKFPVIFTDGVTRRNAPVLVSDAQDPLYPSFMQPVNEAALIEERRKRREAIKAKHRGQVTPMLVQALTLNNEPAGLTSNPNPSGTLSPAPGWFH